MNIIKKLALIFLMVISILVGEEVQNTLIIENPIKEISTVHSKANRLNSEMNISIKKINLEEIQGSYNEGYIEIEMPKLLENEDIFVAKDLNDLSKKQRSSIKNFLLRKNIEEKDRIIILDKNLINPYIIKYDKNSNEVLKVYSLKINTSIVPTEATISITNSQVLQSSPKALYWDSSLRPFRSQYFTHLTGTGEAPDLSKWSEIWSGSATLEIASNPGVVTHLVKSGDRYSANTSLDIGPNFNGFFTIRGAVSYGYVFGFSAGFAWNGEEVNETLIFKGYDSTGKLLTEAKINLKIQNLSEYQKTLNINVSPLEKITNNILVTDPVGVYPGYSVNLSASGKFPNLTYWNQSLRQTIQIGNQSEIDLKINGDSMESNGAIEIGPNLKSVFAIRKKKSYPALVGFRYEWHWNQKEVNEKLIYRQYNNLNEVVAESQINLYIPGYIERKTKTGIVITDRLQLAAHPNGLYIGASLKPFDPKYFQYIQGTGTFPNLLQYEEIIKGTLEVASKPGEIIEMTGGITERFQSPLINIGPNFTGSFVIRGNVAYGAVLGFDANFTWNQKEVDETLIFKGYNSSGELKTTAEINLKIPAYIPEITNQSFRVLDAISMLTPNSKGKILIGNIDFMWVGKSVPTEILGENFKYDLLYSTSKVKIVNKGKELGTFGITSWPYDPKYRGLLSESLNINGLIVQINKFTGSRNSLGSFTYLDVKGWNGNAIDEVLEFEMLNSKNQVLGKYNMRVIVPQYEVSKTNLNVKIKDSSTLSPTTNLYIGENKLPYDSQSFKNMEITGDFPDLSLWRDILNAKVKTSSEEIELAPISGVWVSPIISIGTNFQGVFRYTGNGTPYIGIAENFNWNQKEVDEIIIFKGYSSNGVLLTESTINLSIQSNTFELILGNDFLDFGDVAQNTTKKSEALIKIKNPENKNIKTSVKTNRGLISKSNSSIILPIEKLELSNNMTSNNITSFILSGEISPKSEHVSGNYEGIVEVDIIIE